jgi:Na+-transporting NADH:ubiquinone oxidoreductase subunit NqrE
LAVSAAGWFLVAILAAVVGTVTDGTSAEWLSNLMVYPAGLGVGWALVNVGRALLPDRWRRAKPPTLPPEQGYDSGQG